jgi:hypothetical protein
VIYKQQSNRYWTYLFKVIKRYHQSSEEFL